MPYRGHTSIMDDQLAPGPFPSWDDFRFFLATSETGSFSKAANYLGVTQPTISRRIDNLEQVLSVRLFDRLPNGVSLTVEGESILVAAREIERTVNDIHKRIFGSDQRMDGTVRISVTDGLASYWMVPRLQSLQNSHPGLTVEFLCSIEPADALKMETDLSIRYEQPVEPDLIAVRLATFHYIPWASQAYLDRYGVPRSPEDLLHHKLLDHFAYQGGEGDWSEWFALARAANLITYRTNSSASLLSAIQSGLGIALLPTYSVDCVEGIVPIDLGLKTYDGVWLTYHPNLQSTPRVRVVIDWIKTLFDQQTWPWFREEFVPPKDAVGSEPD